MCSNCWEVITDSNAIKNELGDVLCEECYKNIYQAGKELEEEEEEKEEENATA